jgi:hypothetical protein
MRPLITAFLLLATIMPVAARDIRVFIAPRTHVRPASGKVVFDIYWINTGSRPAAIPAPGRHHFSSLSHGRDLGWAGGNARISVHPPPDRQVAPWSIVRDVVTVDIGRGAAELIEVDAEFEGKRRKFRSNSVVLRGRP